MCGVFTLLVTWFNTPAVRKWARIEGWHMMSKPHCFYGVEGQKELVEWE
jgi:hypothetical protein